MHRPVWMTAPIHSYSHRCQDTLARLLTPLTVWICVSVCIRYGYYRDCRMVLGPSSSRLVKASSVFVEKIQILDEDKKGVSLYSFTEKPELLSLESNWSVSNYPIVGSYGRKEFSLWLNQGSKLSLSLEAPKSLINKLETVVIRGDRKYETMVPKVTSNNLEAIAHNESMKGKRAAYAIEEDDKYRVVIINSNPKTVIFTLTVNVSAKMYDLTKSNDSCSATKGSCGISLILPDTHYVIIKTPHYGNLDDWYLELSYVARVATYIAILGFSTICVYLILKYLGVCDSHESESTPVASEHVAAQEEVTETHPLLLSQKPIYHAYGTTNQEEEEEEDDSGGSSSSSEDLYDAKLCVICYDDQRNCFFVPCGHCATCYDCAQRIMEGESRVCPICRRLIHKTRRLFNP